MVNDSLDYFLNTTWYYYKDKVFTPTVAFPGERESHPMRCQASRNGPHPSPLLLNSCPSISHDSLLPRGPEPCLLLYAPNKQAFHTLPTYLASKESAFWQPRGPSSLRTGLHAEKVLTWLESLTTQQKVKAYGNVLPSNVHLSSQNQIKQKQTLQANSTCAGEVSHI